MDLLDWGGFHLSETPDVPSLGWDAEIKRTAVWGRMKMKNTGREFICITTHLDHKGGEARKKGLDLILDTLAVLNKTKLPCVILGDLNMKVDNAGMERLVREMKSARLTAAAADGKYSFNGFGKSWTGDIDHIFYRGFRKCSRFKVINRKYLHINYISDHYPIMADLEL